MLKGTLDDFTLPDIFRLLSGSRKTGRLDVERSAGRGNVFFRDGDVYFAESTLSRELIGQKLLKAKIVTDGQLMKALDEQAESGGRVGEVLLASGLVSEHELETALRGQVEDAVFDLLRWDSGEFDWAPGETVDAEVVLSVSVENLIMEGSRRLDELAIITRKIPSEHSLVEMAPAPPEGAAEINIRPDEWRVLVLVNGQRTVLDIAEAVGSDVFATMRTLYGLAAAGLIHVPGHVMEDDGEPLPRLPVEPVAAAPVAVEPEPPAVEVMAEPDAEAEPEAEAEVEPVAEFAPEIEVDEPAPATAQDDSSDLEMEGEVPEPAAYHADAYAPEETFEFDESLLRTPVEEPEATEGSDGSEESEDEPSAVEATDLPTSDWFDAPEPGDIMAEEPLATPEEVGGTDPFVDEILAPLDLPDEAAGEPSAEIEMGNEASAGFVAEEIVSTNGHGSDDVSATETTGFGTVDKRDAVRELSDLFKQTEVENVPTFLVPELDRREDDEEEDPEVPTEENRHRVEDDEEITRGLISRLIDGVKGL